MTINLVYSTVACLRKYCLWHQQWYLCTPRFVWFFAFIVTLLSSLQRSSSFESVVVLTTAWPHQISGQVLSIHSIVSSPRTVRSSGPWGGRWIGHWRPTWSTVCFSEPHSQVAEEVIPHLYKQEQKRPTPVRRRLSRSQSLLGRVIPGVSVVVGMKIRNLVGLSAHSAFHGWSAQSAACKLLLLSEELMSCCAAGTNGWLDTQEDWWVIRHADSHY